MYGILTNIEYDKHWIFKNYYYSLINVLGNENIKRVQSVHDLTGIDVLFIGDDHFMPNKEIWMTNEFIEKCNLLNIRVFIFNNEKIFKSSFPWNEDIQREVGRFSNLIQFVYDVEDSGILNTQVNKTYMSRYFLDKIKVDDSPKKDKIVFFGATEGHSYESRRNFLNDIKNYVDVDIIQSSSSVSMSDYMNMISSYRYVLSPLGNGNFVPMRYYETLFLKSIPLQQSTEGINSKFEKEILSNKGIFFIDGRDLVEKINNYTGNYNTDYYMEDFIIEEVLPKINIQH